MVNENPKTTTEVLALVDDLFFQAKLAETARKVGVTLTTVSTGGALVTALEGVQERASPGDLP